jgi:hypothetical protein
MQTTIQLTVEDEFRGRVMSLWMVAGIGFSALGALVLGMAADLFGLSATLVVGGVASLLLSLAFRFGNAPAMARLEQKAAE